MLGFRGVRGHAKDGDMDKEEAADPEGEGVKAPAQAAPVSAGGHGAARRPWGCTKLHSCVVQGLF